MRSSSLIVPKTKQNYLKKNNKCVLCGNPAKSIDHIIPCHVFDMVYLLEYDFRTAVRDKDNWAPMCLNCNKKKSSKFDINDVPSHLRTKYDKQLTTYCDLRKQALIRQDGVCYNCHKPLEETEGILYFNPEYYGNELLLENVITICPKCIKKINRRY